MASSLKVISVAGRMQAGKTSLCEYIETICKARGIRVLRLPFAMPLKIEAKNLGWNGVKDDKGRRLLQLLGTGVGRNCIDPDIWVNKWLQAVRNSQELGVRLVLADDMRFPNEIDAARIFPHLLVKVVRPMPFLKEAAWQLRKITGTLHASEVGFPNAQMDRVIDNSKSLNDLYWAAEHILCEMRP